MPCSFLARRRAIVAMLVGPLVAAVCAAAPSLDDHTFATTIFSVDAGLPSNVTQALAQTRDGYLWVGTEAGLARFDGVRFNVFRTKENPGLGDNLIRCLHEDRDGALWVGTQRGLTRGRDGQFDRIAGLDAPVAAIAEDRAGRLWIGTVGAGLWSFEGGQLIQHADGRVMRRTDSPMRVFVDSTDRVWAALNHGPLLCVDHGVLQVPEGAVAAIRQTNRFLEYPRGTLWLAAQAGLFRWREGELRQFGKAVGIGDEQITDLATDRAGRLWVAGHQVWVADDPETDHFQLLPMPQVEYPRFFLQDREGTYWIATSGDGLARMRASPYRLAKYADQMPLRRVRSVTVDHGNTVWAALGSEQRGAARIHADDRVDFVALGDGADADVWSVYAQATGTVWIGTRGALFSWQDGRVSRHAEARNVRVIFETGSHQMWFGLMDGGIVRWHDGRFDPVSVPAEFARATPNAFEESADGTMFVGYQAEGILRLAPDGRVERMAGMPSLEVRALHFDRAGRLWVGFRRDGLALWSEGKWYNPNDLIQPFGERVSAIDEDDRGNLWLGTVRGVIWGRTADFVSVALGNAVESRFHVAGFTEGLGGGVIGTGTQPTLWHAADGRLWFAGRDGLIAVHPGNITTNTVPPPVHIESVNVDGRSLNGSVFELPAGTNSLEVNYTALSFVQPNRVLFRYRLVGHDAGWVQAGTRRTAFYTHLKPGRYAFEVVACNEDGVWTPSPAVATIVQRPAFYETWWFYAAALVAAGAVAAGLYFWRTAGLRRLVARQTQQIRQQMEKEVELRAELDRKARLESLGVLAGGIAHDFNNLLTVIIANLGLAATDERVRGAAGDVIAAAELGARRAADLTQQLLTFAKGGDPVRRAVALPDVVREAAEFARHGAQVRCDFSIEPDLPPAEVDRAQISRVVHNLVLNATQAMPNGGVVRITLVSVQVAADEVPSLPPGRYIKLSIADSGDGIAPEHLPRLFEPYYSTKPKNHGLGLATVHSIVKRHQGHVSVESQRGRGATFHVWLPAAQQTAPEPATAATGAATTVPLRVLFMDDEDVIRTVAEGIFRRLGHDATLVADGCDAVREYEAALRRGRRYDVVVLDLTVPGGMGGKATVDALRRLDPTVRAIVTSGYSSDPVLGNYQAHGFCAVVPKPYQMQELADAIQQAGRVAAGSGDAVAGIVA